MRALLLLACTAAAGPASATQLAVHLSGGARISGTMVHDSIVAPFDIRPGLASAFALNVSLPAHRGWSGEVLIDVSWATLWRHDDGGDEQALGSLGALSFSAALRRQLPAGFGVRVTVGGLSYLPAEEIGVFRDGSELFPLLGIGVDYGPLFAPFLTVEARADAHSFITPALRDVGFTERRLVPRVAVMLRANLAGLR